MNEQQQQQAKTLDELLEDIATAVRQITDITRDVYSVQCNITVKAKGETVIRRRIFFPK